MKEDILGAVIEVEKEIAKSLETEKNRARDLLEKLGSEAEKEIHREGKRLQYALDKAITEARTMAEEKASKILKDADSLAGKLEKISDDVLKRIIKKHIVRILP